MKFFLIIIISTVKCSFFHSHFAYVWLDGEFFELYRKKGCEYDDDDDGKSR